MVTITDIFKLSISYIDNEPFDVSLFTINNKTKQRYWVGEILGAERVIKKEKGAIVRKYRKRGWDSEMRKQLKGYSLDNAGWIGL